ELKVDLTDKQFLQLCHDNSNLQFEWSATGELIIMSPTGGNTSKSNADLVFQLQAWNRQGKLGEVFDSNGCFQLPNGSKRAADVAWVCRERWDTLTLEEQEQFPPLCPDFVVELLSPSDSLQTTRKKMQEYLDNGIKLGWLINRKKQQVEVYRPDQPFEILEKPQTISGENVLLGFVLDLTTIW
ncbi:MAG: Uma2 family endonuclease, partial [Cyanobacteriota bacterium]|nr:Uma2 family endonuclease [Cyanobacteriota bacterium]